MAPLAYLKARGEGLMRSPSLLECGALLGESGEPIRDPEDTADTERWRSEAWQPAPGFARPSSPKFQSTASSTCNFQFIPRLKNSDNRGFDEFGAVLVDASSEIADFCGGLL